MAIEVNLDALVGPSHHYGGLAYGNRASMEHAAAVSNPRAAALQGLEKAWRVASLGIPQAMLPVQSRPRIDWLRSSGFAGDDAEVLVQAHREAPRLLSAAWSASSMWVANAATVSPAPDTLTQQTQLTPANLMSGLHRQLEAVETTQLLREWLAGSGCVVHEPLSGGMHFRDEGAANHTRFAIDADRPGLELFVCGDAIDPNEQSVPQKYPARQTAEACRALVRRHRLRPSSALLLQQHPAAIDAGVFHNDVIAVGHRDMWAVHEKAYASETQGIEQVASAFQRWCDAPLRVVRFSEAELPLEDAVCSYLFNSQWLTDDQGRWTLIVPRQCEQIPSAARAVERLQSEIRELHQVIVVDLDQSMANGGGPACLRLRVAMSHAERTDCGSKGWLTADRYAGLKQLIETRYRDRLVFDDLCDPELVRESQEIRRQTRMCLGFEDRELCSVHKM